MPRDRFHLWRSLTRRSSAAQDPKIVLDRRQGDQRQRVQPVQQERRREDRRRPSPSAFDAIHTFLGEGTQLKGELSLDGGVRVDGHLEGEIIRGEILIIGEHGQVNADIEVGLLQVRGQVQGNITARQRVELRGPSQVTGTIRTPCLMIWEGAFFSGKYEMAGPLLLPLTASTFISMPGGRALNNSDQLKGAVEVAQKECERLQHDCELLRAEMSRLQADHERSQREREELARWFTRLMNEATSRLRTWPPAA